ncbi:MAG TPA: response regulator [Polyangia bacterium]|nr:response regulator [Polyangia bacterium]
MSVVLPLHIGPKVDVLVVDDNPFMRAAVSRILQRQGRQCVAVATIDEAKMTLLDHPPSLVLTDFALGRRETGVDLVRWIRSQPTLRHLACGFMSGSDRGEIDDALRAAGLPALPVLEKPFGLADLELFLATLLTPARNTTRLDVS